MQRESSILDIARQSGVSKSTVSRVLNGGSVSNRAQQAVQDAITALQYRPNAAARALRGCKSMVIGVAVRNQNPFLHAAFSIRFAGINEVLMQAGYSLLLIHSDDSAGVSHLENAFSFLQENRIDGLICIGMQGDANDLSKTERFREIVYTGERIHPEKGFRIYLGNYNYSFTIYQYLLAKGHTRMMTLIGDFNGDSLTKRRMEAGQNACAAAKTAVFENKLFDYTSLHERAEECIFDLFCAGHYTAIFADTDEITARIVHCFSAHGLHIAEDFSIVTIHRGNPEPRHNMFTGVTLSDFLYGQECGRLILKVLQNPELEYEDVIIPYTFEEHGTVQDRTIKLY